MIGWNVDVGISSKTDLGSISDITVLDRNRPFTLFEGTLTDGYIAFDNASALAEGLEQFLGNDFFTLYLSQIGITEPNQLEELYFVAPSLPLSYPTINAGNYTNIAYSFPSLNKVIYIQAPSIGRIKVYNNSNGTLTEISNIGWDNFNMPNCIFGNGTSTRLIGYNKDIGYMSLYIGVPGLRYSYQVVQRSSMNNTLISVFGESPNPDFTVIKPDNPLDPIPPSGSGDDNPVGTFDDESDLIPDSSLPTLSSANTGFTRIYNPTLSQVQDLARYLWTDETLIQTLWNKIKQYFEDPMQAIIGFNLVPVPVPDAGTKNFALMYIDTGVSMNVAASQFVDRDCGTFKLEPYYGSALDYSPYTKVSAYLPFIGVVQLDVDEVMGRTLQVKYRVDICSGSCVAKILVDGNVLYQYSGHCAINIPFAASDFSSYVQAAISVAKLGVAAAVAAAGGPPPVGTMDPSQQTNQVVTTTQTTETARNPMTGRQITTGTRTTVETREAPASQGSTQASFSALSPSNVSNTVGQIMSSKPVVNHSGSFSGNTGYLGVRRPYLIIERPNLCMPQNFQTMNGYPSMITMELSTCKGYTRVQQVQLTGLTATNPEQAEIQELLKSGVIF